MEWLIFKNTLQSLHITNRKITSRHQIVERVDKQPHKIIQYLSNISCFIIRICNRVVKTYVILSNKQYLIAMGSKMGLSWGGEEEFSFSPLTTEFINKPITLKCIHIYIITATTLTTQLRQFVDTEK